MFKDAFDGVPSALRGVVEERLEKAVWDAVHLVQEGEPTLPYLITCVTRMSEVILLSSAISHGIRKEDKKRK